MEGGDAMTVRRMAFLRRVPAAFIAAALLAGCDDGRRVEDDATAAMRGAEEAAGEAESTSRELVASRRAVVCELMDGVEDPARRAALEAERDRLSEEIRKANNNRMRRDRELVRLQIMEKTKGGK